MYLSLAFSAESEPYNGYEPDGIGGVNGKRFIRGNRSFSSRSTESEPIGGPKR